MNDLEYLHQISQTNRPVAKEGGIKGLLKSKIFKVIAIGVGLLIFVLILGAMLSQISGKEKDSLVKINLRMTNLSTTVTNYNSLVKSPKLRAMGASLTGILSETSSGLYEKLVADYNYSEDGVAASVQTEEAALAAERDAMLERARLNGILDRSYLHQLIYEVASLLALESEAMARTSNEEVKQILEDSTNSLNVLYEQISNYKDSTN